MGLKTGAQPRDASLLAAAETRACVIFGHDNKSPDSSTLRSSLHSLTIGNVLIISTTDSGLTDTLKATQAETF